MNEKNENISYDEKLIAEVLTKCDGENVVLKELDIPNIPNCDEFKEISVKIDNSNEKMNLLKENRAAREIVCYKRFFRPFVILYRKIVRKFMLKWYIEPICTQQTEFNTASGKSSKELSALCEKQLLLINDLYGKCSALENELKENKAEIAELKKILANNSEGDTK